MIKRKKVNKHNLKPQKPAQIEETQQDTNVKKSVGLLVATAQEYHLRYAAEIAYEIEFHNHLSVLMPAMIGLYPLPLNLYDGLDFRCREYIIVNDQEDIDEFNIFLISEQDENKCIYPILYENFIKTRPVGGCYVLFDLPQEKRMDLSRILAKNKNVAVISIGKLEESNVNARSSMVGQAQDVMTELFQITMKDGRPHCMVFPVEDILDIRDLMFAGVSEKSRLVSALNNICSDYEIDYKISDKQTNSSGNAEKIAQYKTMLAERDFEISILRSVAFSAGVDINDFENGIAKVKRIKQAYVEKYDQTTDQFEQEKLETAFQNEVSDFLVSITCNMLTIKNRDNYIAILIDQLGEEVWNRLTERSRTYLVSAMMTFDSINGLHDHTSLDYSGVCLQVTKVLDEEMTARFYIRYKHYLFDTCLLKDWPQAMKSKYGDEPLAPNDFTIGSLAYVVGVGANGHVYDSLAFDLVKGFAKKCLYKSGLSDQVIHDHLIECVECAEKTRKDYRNPAAHRETMSYVSARECIDYLIEQTKMLKQILQDMKV